MSSRSANAPRRLFVDSGVFIALFSARDGRHAEADRLVREAFDRKIALFTSNLVVAEVQRLLLHRAGIKASFAALNAIDGSRGLTVAYADERVHVEARAWLARLSEQVITYTDAASFALMKRLHCDAALSFDRDFALAGFSLWRGER